MRHFVVAAALLTSLGVGCASEEPFDELEAEEETDSSRADGVGEFTYFTVLRDTRRCAPPACGGLWVNRVNRAKTTCADGRKANACYVAELRVADPQLDPGIVASMTAGIPISASADTSADPEPAKLLVRGEIEEADVGGLPAPVFRVDEAWSGVGVVDGPMVRVRSLDVQCISAPCDNMEERKLNSSVTARIADMDLSAIVDERDQASLVDATGGPDGIIICGRRYSVAPSYKGRRVAAAYQRISIDSQPAP